jgi:hypothetical protein
MALDPVFQTRDDRKNLRLEVRSLAIRSRQGPIRFPSSSALLGNFDRAPRAHRFGVADNEQRTFLKPGIPARDRRKNLLAVKYVRSTLSYVGRKQTVRIAVSLISTTG